MDVFTGCPENKLTHGDFTFQSCAAGTSTHFAIGLLLGSNVIVVICHVRFCIQSNMRNCKFCMLDTPVEPHSLNRDPDLFVSDEQIPHIIRFLQETYAIALHKLKAP